MFNEFQKNMKLVIEESKNPVLIIGNPGDGKVTYLKDKYKTFIVPLQDIAETSEWYLDMLTFCNENKSDKCLIVFDDIGKLKNDILQSLYQIILNENGNFNLPENAIIICTMNGFRNLPVESSELFKSFLECLTILDGQDKNNISINWNNNKKLK